MLLSSSGTLIFAPDGNVVLWQVCSAFLFPEDVACDVVHFNDIVHLNNEAVGCAGAANIADVDADRGDKSCGGEAPWPASGKLAIYLR